MKFLTAKVAGTPSKSAWAQVHTHAPSDEEKKTARGELLVALSVSQVSEEVEAVALGKEIITRLHEEYFGKEEGRPFEALKKAVEKVWNEFSSGEEPAAKVEVITLVIWGEYVYFAAAGGGKVALWREGELVSLLTTRGEPVAVSGKPQVNDIFIFGTSVFFDAVSQDLLSTSIEKSTVPSDLADNIAPLIHSRTLPSLAAAIVKVSELESLPTTAEEAQAPTEKPQATANLFLDWWMKSKEPLIALAKKLPKENIYIKKGGKSRRTTVSVGLIILFLLLVSIGLGLRQKNIRDYRSSYEDRLVQAQTLFEDSILQKEANSAKSAESFLQAKAIAETLAGEGIKDPRLETLLARLGEEEEAVLGKVQVEPETFLDLSLVRAGVEGAELVFDEGILAVFDKGGGRVISVTQDKKTEVVAGETALSNPQNIALYSGRYFSLGDKGIVEVQRRSAAKTAVAPDEEWGEIKSLSAFGGNLYLLDRKGEIWRYPAIEAGFGSRQRWFGEGVSPDLSLSADMAIDGSIWILSSSGKISKFTRGAPDSFRVSGLDKEFLNPTALYTDEDLESILVLDKENKRIVELLKTGEYKKQYIWEGMQDVRDIAVSQETGKIFLLTETKILELPLK